MILINVLKVDISFSIACYVEIPILFGKVFPVNINKYKIIAFIKIASFKMCVSKFNCVVLFKINKAFISFLSKKDFDIPILNVFFFASESFVFNRNWKCCFTSTCLQVNQMVFFFTFILIYLDVMELVVIIELTNMRILEILLEILRIYVKDSIFNINEMNLFFQFFCPQRGSSAPISVPFMVTPWISYFKKLKSLSIVIYS